MFELRAFWGCVGGGRGGGKIIGNVSKWVEKKGRVKGLSIWEKRRGVKREGEKGVMGG